MLPRFLCTSQGPSKVHKRLSLTDDTRYRFPRFPEETIARMAPHVTIPFFLRLPCAVAGKRANLFIPPVVESRYGKLQPSYPIHRVIKSLAVLQAQVFQHLLQECEKSTDVRTFAGHEHRSGSSRNYICPYQDGRCEPASSTLNRYPDSQDFYLTQARSCDNFVIDVMASL